jgi:hypothetical protein
MSSKEAIDLYGVTRLAAVVCKLKENGWVFVEPAKTEHGLDRHNNPSSWARYELINEPSEAAIKKKLEEKKKTQQKKKSKEEKPVEEIIANIPSDKRVVLRPKQYEKHEGNSKEFAGKQIIQVNLFDNGNTEI